MKTKACQKQSSVKWATALKILKVSYLSSFLKIINIYITPTKCITKQKKKNKNEVSLEEAASKKATQTRPAFVFTLLKAAKAHLTCHYNRKKVYII